MRFAWLAAAVTMIPAVADAQPPTRPAATAPTWVAFVTIVRLRDEFAARPAEANMNGQHREAWANIDRPVELPAPLRNRTFTAQSYILLDVDAVGHAAGCRPLRAGREPQLDALACTILMRPGYFSATLLPPRQSVAGRWVMGLSWRSLTAAAHRAQQASAPRMLFSPPAPPAPAPAPAPPPPPKPQKPPR